MLHGYSNLRMPSHSNEVEGRFVRLEIGKEQTDEEIEAHHKRITFLERMLQGILYAIGALAAGKSGDLAEFVLTILKVKS